MKDKFKIINQSKSDSIKLSLAMQNTEDPSILFDSSVFETLSDKDSAVISGGAPWGRSARGGGRNWG